MYDQDARKIKLFADGIHLILFNIFNYSISEKALFTLQIFG